MSELYLYVCRVTFKLHASDQCQGAARLTDSFDLDTFVLSHSLVMCTVHPHHKATIPVSRSPSFPNPALVIEAYWLG